MFSFVVFTESLEAVSYFTMESVGRVRGGERTLHADYICRNQWLEVDSLSLYSHLGLVLLESLLVLLF